MNTKEIVDLLEELVDHGEFCDNDGTSDTIISKEQANNLRSFLETLKK